MLFVYSVSWNKAALKLIFQKSMDSPEVHKSKRPASFPKSWLFKKRSICAFPKKYILHWPKTNDTLQGIIGKWFPHAYLVTKVTMKIIVDLVNKNQKIHLANCWKWPPEAPTVRRVKLVWFCIVGYSKNLRMNVENSSFGQRRSIIFEFFVSTVYFP